MPKKSNKNKISSQINQKLQYQHQQQLIQTQSKQNYQQQSVQQQILQPSNSPYQDQYQNQLILDQNDQFQIYQQSQYSNKPSNSQPYLLSKTQHQSTPNQQHNQSQSYNLKSNPSNLQTDQEIQNDTQKVIQLIKNQYSHFNQQILIQMLYDKCFPKQDLSKSFDLQNNKQPKENLKFQDSPQFMERADMQTIKKMHRHAKIFVQHGYGINIARKYAQKGQIILPNPYNNLISKIIKQAWKNVQIQVNKTRKNLKKLNHQQFNQIKTPLTNARAWMKQQYIDIFLNITAYSHGLKVQKPSQKEYEMFYDFLIPKSKGPKAISDKKTEYKKKKLKQNYNKYEEDQSNQQFKVPYYHEKNISHQKKSKSQLKKNKHFNR